MTSATTPELSQVTDLMRDLVGLNVQPASGGDTSLHLIAEYVDDGGNPVTRIACDLASGCRMGAALTQVPAGCVKEAVADGAVPANLAENLDEIFNILVNLVATDDTHMVFHRSVQRGTDEEFDVALDAVGESSATEYQFDIDRYGVCRMVIAS